MMEACDVRRATHVKYQGAIYEIKEKWGVSHTGRLAKPSEGGFGVVLESGLGLNMYDAELYYRRGRSEMTWVLTVARVIGSVEDIKTEDPVVEEVVGGEAVGAGTFLPTMTRDQQFLSAGPPDLRAVAESLAERFPGRHFDLAVREELPEEDEG